MKVNDLTCVSATENIFISSGTSTLSHISNGTGFGTDNQEYFITKCRRSLCVQYWMYAGRKKRLCKSCYGLPKDDLKMTVRANLVLTAIIAYKIENNGNSPTIRIIMNETGISSTSVVSYYLNKLELLGKITRGISSYARDIAVIGAKWIPPDYYGGIHDLQVGESK